MNDMRQNLLRPWRWRFITFALLIGLILGAILALFWREIPEDSRMIVFTIGAILLLALYGLLIWFYQNLTRSLLLPLLSLGRDMEAKSFSGAKIDENEYSGSLIAPFVRGVAHDIPEPSNSTNKASETWLSEIMHVLDQGMIVASMDHEILLINSRAREMLGRNAALALGRNLGGFLDIETINHAIKRQMSEDATGSERVFCRILSDDHIMPVRMSLLHSRQGELLGYALAFHDLTNLLYSSRELEHCFEALLFDARDFVAQSRLLHMAGLPVEDLHAEISKKLMVHKQNGQVHMGQAWPKGRITLRNLFRVLGERTNGVEIATPPEAVFLKCDGAAMIETVEHLLKSLGKKGFQLHLDFEILDQDVKIQIASGSKKIPMSYVEEAMREALVKLPTAPTGHEVLRAHGTEIWPHIDDDRTQLVFILRKTRTQLNAGVARPDYYDFEISKPSSEILDRNLRDLSVVVFDCESTGLDPKGGDKVVQLSAVRVKAGKVITDEYFDQLVNPERKIPPSSTEIHKITDAMVEDAPTFDVVAGDFHKFCHGEVLLAHNAAFDMAFLRKGAEQAHVEFNQPVLDTVFMSAFLFDHTGKHTLDDLAKRFDIVIDEKDRHTALGDSIATAQIFVRLIPMLEARGIHSLGQMLEIGSQMRAIRKQQSRYG